MKPSLQNQLFFAVLALAVSSFFLASCAKPPEREAVVSSKVSKNLIEITNLPDISTEKTRDQVALKNNSFLAKAIAKLKKNNTEVTEALKSDNLEILILNDRMQFYKKVKSEDYDKEEYSNKNIYSDRYLLKQKQIAKTEDAAGIQVLSEELNTAARIRPANLGYVLIASLGITAGILENEKTDYNEKKSILNISPRSLQFATHIVLGSELDITEDQIPQHKQVVSE